MTPRRITTNDLRTAGWRQDGDAWYPPWPSPYSYTLMAAKLEQGMIAKHTPSHKPKAVLPLRETP